MGIDTECLEGGQKDENGGPPMPHGERQVDERLIGGGLGGMILLDDIVNVADSRGDQEGKGEYDDIMVVGPDGNKDRVEDGEEGNLQEILSATTAFVWGEVNWLHETVHIPSESHRSRESLSSTCSASRRE